MPNLALLALEASDGTVVLTSITLVFAMLVALCLIITLEGNGDDCGLRPKQGGAVGAVASRMQGPLKGRSRRWGPQLVQSEAETISNRHFFFSCSASQIGRAHV